MCNLSTMHLLEYTLMWKTLNEKGRRRKRKRGMSILKTPAGTDRLHVQCMWRLEKNRRAYVKHLRVYWLATMPTRVHWKQRLHVETGNCTPTWVYWSWQTAFTLYVKTRKTRRSYVKHLRVYWLATMPMCKLATTPTSVSWQQLVRLSSLCAGTSRYPWAQGWDWPSRSQGSFDSHWCEVCF